MLPDRVSNPGPLTYESGALPIALRDPANFTCAQFLFGSKQKVRTGVGVTKLIKVVEFQLSRLQES